MIFERHLDHVRDRRSFSGRLSTEEDLWSWDRALHFLDTHPPDLIDLNDNKKRFYLKNSHHRHSQPLWAKGIVQEMIEAFPQNTITNIVFLGIGKDSQSYPRHADKMDVFLVQAIADVELRVEGYRNESTFTLKPKDFIWIPRGIHHEIIPSTSRVTFSFGVEGQPNPITYV